MWYSRKNEKPENSSQVTKTLAITPILIDRLHAKFYFNEKTAVITSMNLTQPSDEKSLDIGYYTENQQEYDEVIDFYNSYIKHNDSDLENQPINPSMPLDNNSKTDVSSIRQPTKKDAYTKAQSPKAEKLERVRKEDVSRINKGRLAISNHEHLNDIHHYIAHKYGEVEYTKQKYKESYSLEYFDCPENGFSLQFIPGNKNLATVIQMPGNIVVKELYEAMKRELGNDWFRGGQITMTDFGQERSIKFNFEAKKDIASWGLYDAIVAELIHNMGVFIETVMELWHIKSGRS